MCVGCTTAVYLLYMYTCMYAYVLRAACMQRSRCPQHVQIVLDFDDFSLVGAEVRPSVCGVCSLLIGVILLHVVVVVGL